MVVLSEVYERWRLWRFIKTWRRARYELREELTNDDLYQVRPRRKSEPRDRAEPPAVIHRARVRSRSRRKMI